MNEMYTLTSKQLDPSEYIFLCPSQCSDIIPESKAVLQLVDEQVEPCGGDGFPVIVIEGLDATG